MPQSMPEYALTRNYLELMVELPWSKSTTGRGPPSVRVCTPFALESIVASGPGTNKKCLYIVSANKRLSEICYAHPG